MEEETGLKVEPIELIELLDRIVREKQREASAFDIHYVIADYLCRVIGGALKAASDAEAVRWVERAEWNSHSVLALDPDHGAGDRGGMATSGGISMRE